ncbi:hypothetical protein CRE_19008 [Caenorhabditis remanei]|uniref:G-protein coupled receptors family 1 profile domain-containing protein n=1 Tax=Caenorhabditis remanei TaxID=31234 RepID=E3LL25_CAERE|nr:hypothetical protein CRE_19008 [Caenorhabditis remanei]
MMDSIVITVSSTAILFSALAIITNSWLLFSIFVSQKLKKSSSLALFYAKFAVDIVFGFADLVTVFLMLSKLLSTSPGILDYYPNLYFYAVWSALTISNLRTFFVLTINFDRVFAVFFPLFYFKFRVKIANSVLILIPFLHIIVDNSVLWGFCEFELNISSGCITSICLGMSCYIKYLLALEVVAHSLIVSTSLLLAGKLFIWNNCKTGVKSKELERANQLALIDALIIFVFGVVPAVVMTIFPSLFERLGSILIVAKMSGNALESYLVYRALKREKVTTSTVKARSFLAAGATSTKQISD